MAVGQLLAKIASPSRPSSAQVRRLLFLTTLTLLVWAIYYYFISAGGGSPRSWAVYGTYIDRLADGFLSGHLYILHPPDPELVAAKNPYDRVNIRHWLFDASYYEGRYYVYWGPLPALIQAAGKWALGIKRLVGDQYVGLFFLCVGAWFSVLLVERVARRLFGGVSWPLLTLGVLALTCANPTLHAVTTAGTYHTAIMSAQACMLGGLVAAFDAVWYSETARARRWQLGLAGLGFGLALACRVSVVPAIAALCIVTLLADVWNAKRRFLKLLSSGAWLGAPLVVIVGFLLLYNKLRFEDWFEFGTGVQTSGLPPFRVSASYLLPNLYSYMFRPGDLSCQFPYLYQVWFMGADAFPIGYTLPQAYIIQEPVIGWALAVPLTWLLPFAFILAPMSRIRRNASAVAHVWCLVAFCAMASLSGLIGLGLYWATMRYMSDITFGLVLLSLLAAFGLNRHRFARRFRRPTALLIAALALSTIILGMLIGYQGYNGHFHAYNRALDAKLVKALSVCGTSVPKIPKFQP